jgi:hypothetical protein
VGYYEEKPLVYIHNTSWALHVTFLGDNVSCKWTHHVDAVLGSGYKFRCRQTKLKKTKQKKQGRYRKQCGWFGVILNFAFNDIGKNPKNKKKVSLCMRLFLLMLCFRFVYGTGNGTGTLSQSRNALRHWIRYLS